MRRTSARRNGSLPMTTGWDMNGAFKYVRSTACTAVTRTGLETGIRAAHPAAHRPYFDPSTPITMFMVPPLSVIRYPLFVIRNP